MGGSVIFYTYGSTLELNGQQLTAGMLTADLLNLSPDEYMRLKKRMTQITDLAEEYERKRKRDSLSVWQTNSPSAAKTLPSTCSIRVRQIWKMEWLFIMRCSAPSVLPRMHGVITKSTSAVMKHIFTTFALSTVLFGISSVLVCPS